MYLLDTDHISLMHRGGVDGRRIKERLATLGPGQAYVSIVSYEEQSRGWLAETARARSIDRQRAGYEKLAEVLSLFCSTPMLYFDENVVAEFQRLWLMRLRIGTMDLKIAAIALANDAVLLTRNRSDFEKIPGLKFADWTR